MKGKPDADNYMASGLSAVVLLASKPDVSVEGIWRTRDEEEVKKNKRSLI